MKRARSRRRFLHAGNYELRRDATIKLRDGSEATCSRYKARSSKYCTQHLAEGIASSLRQPIDWDAIRDATDLATYSDLSPSALDRLTDMVERRTLALVDSTAAKVG
jgi:hypothetical protein